MNRAGNIPFPPEGGYVHYEKRGWWGRTPDCRIITEFHDRPSSALLELSARVWFEQYRRRWINGPRP